MKRLRKERGLSGPPTHDKHSSQMNAGTVSTRDFPFPRERDNSDENATGRLLKNGNTPPERGANLCAIGTTALRGPRTAFAAPFERPAVTKPLLRCGTRRRRAADR